MTEVDAMDFYQTVTDGSSSDKSEEYTLVHDSNKELPIQLTVVNRKTLLDELNKLPDELLATLSEAEDEDEAQELAEQRNMLSNVNGNTIEAFENICALSMKHEEWTQHNIDDIVKQLGFEALFEMGSRVIELSFENSGTIKDFRETGSGKNS